MAGDEASRGADVLDLSAAEPMAPYREARQVGDLGYGSGTTYCVQVQPCPPKGGIPSHGVP